MIAYRFDRSGSLKENSTLNLIPTGASIEDPTISLYGFDFVSAWGNSCYKSLTTPPSVASFGSFNSLSIDLQAEAVRKALFPNKPSRFKSIFAVKQLSDFSAWKDILHINSESSIFEIECTSAVELDAYFLRGGISSDPFVSDDLLIKYWSGEKSSSPLPELLIPLPVIVNRRLTANELVF